MAQYSKINFVYRLQKWMDSVPGQTFLNYAYSWGAAIVILGTLFKLTHLPGANFMLFLGMGTEVVVFFLSAFDRPFDKTADGRELPTHAFAENEETATPTIVTVGQPASGGVVAAPTTVAPAAVAADGEGAKPSASGTPVMGGVVGGSQIIIGSVPTGGAGKPVATEGGQQNVAQPDAETVKKVATEMAASLQQQGTWIAGQQESTPEMQEAQSNYVDALNSLTEMLQKVSAQSERLTRDSEEMENLNRTLTGITKIYEMQLKAASQQVGTIDQINEQTRKMASLIEQLNNIYGRMIEAMTVNMRVAAPGAALDPNQ